MIRVLLTAALFLSSALCHADSGFDPLALKPQMWIAPRLAAVSSGGLISELTDLSGNGRSATQSDSGNRPTLETVNGVPMAFFSGKRMDFASADWGTEFTFACVVRSNADLGYYIRIFEAIGWNVHSCYSVANTTTPSRFWFDVKASSMPAAVGVGYQNKLETIILIFRFNGKHRSIRQSGETYLAHAAASPPTTTTGVARLGQATAGGYGWSGWIGDCAYWTRSLSDAECEGLESYWSGIYSVPLRPRSAKYLAVSFAGTSDESLYVYGSNDAKNFARLEAAFTPTTGTVRNPSYRYSGDKHLLAYSSGGFNVPNTSFGVAVASTPSGLEPWQFETIAQVDCSGVTGCNQVWSTHWFEDEDGGEHVATCISTNGNSGPFVPHEVHPTNAPRTAWSVPTPITGPGIPANCIDVFIWHENGKYFLLGKDEAAADLVLCVSQYPTSGFVRIKTGMWYGFGHAEAPHSLIVDGKRRIYFDDYLGVDLVGVHYVETEGNWESGTWGTAVRCLGSPVLRAGHVANRN